MNVPILDILSNLSQKDLDLRLGPTQDSGVGGEGEAGQTVEEVHLLPQTQLLLFLRRRPGVDGPLEDLLHHVLEPGVAHPFLVPIGAGDRSAHDVEGLNLVVGPLVQRRVFGQRAVVGADGELYVVQFQPTAWIEESEIQYISVDSAVDGNVRVRALLEALLDQSWPVLNAACQHAAMDEVKLVRIRPVLFDIIHLELQVWRHASQIFSMLRYLLSSGVTYSRG